MAATLTPEEPSRQSPIANSLKRRQSDSTEHEDNKRPRVTSGKNSPLEPEEGPIARVEPEEHDQKRPSSAQRDPEAEDKKILKTEAPRKNGAGDEKQRSRRLFGALLGNLNRPSDRASKRRTEIEQRRQTELKQQDNERLEDRQRRLTQLTVHRRKEQMKVDEQNMRIRHRNMIKAANFLQTKTEPKLYYRPWDLLSDEEDRIDDQVRDAQAKIDEEIERFSEQRREDAEEVIVNAEDDESSADQIDSNAEIQVPSKDEEPHTETERGIEEEQAKSTDIVYDSKPDEIPDLGAIRNDSPPGSEQVVEASQVDSATKGERKDEAEDEEEHVVEGDEDNVIY